MTETACPTDSLQGFIKRLDNVSINGVPLTTLHQFRGILSSTDIDVTKSQEKGGVWENVAEHGAMSMLVSNVLGKALRLDKEQRGYVNLVSWLEDSGKKTERMWQKDIEESATDPDDAALRQQRMLNNLADMEELENIDSGLIVSPKAISRLHRLMGMNIPPSEEGHGEDLAAKIRWFTDAIVHGSEIVSIEERFNRLEEDPLNGQRNIKFSDSFRNMYNGKSLYEVQRSLGAKYEKEFSKQLGITTEALYERIRDGVAKRMGMKFMIRRRFALPSQ